MAKGNFEVTMATYVYAGDCMENERYINLDMASAIYVTSLQEITVVFGEGNFEVTITDSGLCENIFDYMKGNVKFR